MKRAVILCLLISVILLVKCDDEGTLNANDDEGSLNHNDVDVGSDDESIETEFGTDEKDLDGDIGTDVEDNDDDDNKSSLKCLVCKAVIEVMLYEVEKVDPRKRIEVTSTKSIQYSKSESYLGELMEDLCEYADTFATLRQVLVQKTIINDMLKNGGSVDAAPEFAPESLTTENVNYLCLAVIEENDDVILKEFMKEVLPANIDEIVCTEAAAYCDKEETEANSERDEL